ncbi:long-chain acyl-CoA synthetase [Blastococcus aggregatus]|uniref:Long-chain acyl-CoA synthetase n=1 Tax=Blastococcus aggregatus TaxID=38502 RepID=A0A285VBC2_9ACTN|nr:AMP-binding protein [Blastococcus aggregatus]SOC49781.1 long-chain acyl-CoA synthetase [Blastococcus aggregatus]
MEATPTGARTVARLARFVEVALADCDLSLPQYRLLSLLSEGSVNASTLARRLVVSRPSVTALVDGLVARGMVERGTDPADRRHVTHLVTERGQAVLDAADRTAASRLQDLSAHLSPDDVPAARAGLAAWGRALDSYRETATRARHWPTKSTTGDSMPPTTSEDTAAREAGAPSAGQPDTAALAAQAAATGMLSAFWATVQPGAPAIRSAQGDRTFAELNARTNQLSRALRARGLQAGDSIALVSSNRPEFVETLYAAQRTGLRLTPVNWHLTADEINYILRDCGARAVVVDGRFVDTVGEALDGVDARALLVVDGAHDRFEDYEQALAAESGEDIEDPVLGTTMAYTSGTTGRPKGVHRPPAPPSGAGASELATLVAEASAYVPGQDLNLVTGPLYHSAPLLFSLSMPLSRGAGVVLMDKWDAEETLRLVERHRITHTHLVPTMFHRMISLPQEVKDRYDLGSLRNIWHGAAPCPVPVKQALMDWLGPIAWEYYAATEGFGSVVGPEEWLARPGTVGHPTPGHIRILDDAREDLPAGVPGTIYLRAPDTGRFVYLGDEDKTSSSYLGDYYTLGDVGYLDEEGWLFLTDRSVDLIISGGVNVYPAEVEAVLITHPSVGDVGVIGVPDPEWGESVKAVVELQPGYEPTPALAEELQTWARERLAHFKCPRTVDFVEELPRTPSGKLSKRVLRENFRQQAAAGTDA